MTSLAKVHEVFTAHRELAAEAFSSTLLKEAFEAICANLRSVDGLLAAINPEAAKQKDFNNLFTDPAAQCPPVHAAKTAIKDIERELKRIRGDLRQQLGNPSLDYKQVNQDEYLVEVRNTAVKQVPRSWTVISKTKAVTRFHPPEVAAQLELLNQQRELLTLEAHRAWLAFLDQCADNYDEHRLVVQRLAELDCLLSLATVAAQEGYCAPEIDADSTHPYLLIEAGRHPVVDTLMVDQQFVPNDTALDASAESCMIITGPNMGGKSCYIRQVGSGAETCGG